MRNRFVFTSSVLLLALHAFGCSANPEGDTTNPTGEVSTPAPDPAPGAPATPEPPATPAPEPEGTPEPVPSETEPPPQAPSTPEPTPTAPPEVTPAPAPSGVDGFGVTMLYPTKPGGETWALAENANADKRFDPQGTITRNADGSWKMKSTKVRMSAFPSSGYNAKQIATYDRDVLASRGYMQAPNDWKNIEMTGFVKVNAVNNNQDNFAWYARGGKHNDNNSGCEGSSYKGGLHYDGRVRWEKETWHVSYDQTPYKSVTSALKGRWVGFKAVMRNVPGAKGGEAVKLELYLNDNADKVTWKKVYDTTDDGKWGGDAQHCGGSVGAMPITWGGPIATFRWDSATDVDFKWLSVREIQP